MNTRLQRLIKCLTRFPGIGEKTAQRYALHLLMKDSRLAQELGTELIELHTYLGSCPRCGYITEKEEGKKTLCSICLDPKREPTLLCIVARVQDLLAIERTGSMRGRYFILGALLSPLEGIGPEHLHLNQLFSILREKTVQEIILATPPSVEGEATALFLKKELEPFAIPLTRIASGLPHGGELEFADPITMNRALVGRQRF
ncbi:recombination mediator RecR [Pajaroellobacter abortibovis]|uniref:Recombination protein RecR n=1 Tax=Pajaroellobacter abortibovis TaxID=1882918 RepID=A0A1L6MX20_9BACT|nr:recombination mediator RecR [Pajaroellobacter abortibovis]APS00093.1 recombination protein RecR [Pajaroellobacter abortibovis]